jgi:dienelactone hydrolase
MVILIWPWSTLAQSPDLPRRAGATETIPGVESIYGSLATRDGLTLRTIITRPRAASGRLPGLLFVQWLSCDSIELPETARSGWSRMLRRLVQESGYVVWRTEKAGVGDSQGDCAKLDYNTELAHHREALDAFRRSPLVDPNRIVVFGASMGANMAPLVADGQAVAGVMVWGGGARTWFERQLAFSRHAMELSSDSASQIVPRINQHARFYVEYLLNQRTPAQIRAADPTLGSVWSDLVGTSGDLHFGRPVQFHQQAQQQDWAGAWARTTAPVLVLYGEYDWFEDVDAAQGIVRVVNRRGAERAVLKIIPRMDHHFSQYASMEGAFREAGGIVNEGPAVQEMLEWLRRF